MYKAIKSIENRDPFIQILSFSFKEKDEEEKKKRKIT